MKVLILAGAGNTEVNNNRRYRTILEANQIDYLEIPARELKTFAIPKDITHCIFFYSHRDRDRQFADTVLPIIEDHMGIQTFPSFRERWHFDNKIAEAYLSQFSDIPMAKTWVFWDENEAHEFVENTQFPIVMKFAVGSGSKNVALIRNTREAHRAINRVFFGTVPAGYGVLRTHRTERLERLKNTVKGKLHHANYNREYWHHASQYVLLQEFLGENSHDTRITVIGDRTFAFRRSNRPHDFRASGSNLIDHDPDQIDMNFITIAQDLSKKLKFRSMGYDFVYAADGTPRITEFCYRYVTEILRKCPGQWDETGNWMPGHRWPETQHLQTLLNLPHLGEPEDLA
jgi:glutathione synthase/RimK-type ligase-like ATP-grasp enzyme